MRINEPGIYTDFPADAYFSDPTPDPSLTQSLAKVLIERSPRHAWMACPRLNPSFERKEKAQFDIGNAAHWHLIGRGKDMTIVDAADWRTKEAKQARESAAAAGKLAVLRKDYERAGDMAEAALDQLEAAGMSRAWAPDAGDGEVVIAWRDDGMWCRGMIDWVERDLRTVWDYKTTGASAAPHAIPVKMASDGWDLQAAMHERGLDELDPAGIGRRRHRFVCQEDTPPYALTVTELTEAALTMGRKKLAMASASWKRCIAAGTRIEDWPGYPQHIIRPEYPAFLEARFLDRESAEAS